MKRGLEKYAPSFLVLLTDVAICLVSLAVAYQIRFNFNVPDTETNTYITVFSFVFIIRIISFLISKTYKVIIRHTSTRDTVRILLTLLTGSLLMVISNPINFHINGRYLIPFSIIIIEFLLSVFLMVTGRLIVKVIYMELKNPSREKTGVLIYGAGEAGLTTKRTLDRDKATKYKVVAFIDDDPKKNGKKLESISIHPSSAIEKLIRKKKHQAFNYCHTKYFT